MDDFENELRRFLTDEQDAFDPSPELPSRIGHRTRQRQLRRRAVVLTAGTLVIAAAFAVPIGFGLTGSTRPSQSAARIETSPSHKTTVDATPGSDDDSQATTTAPPAGQAGSSTPSDGGVPSTSSGPGGGDNVVAAPPAATTQTTGTVAVPPPPPPPPAPTVNLTGPSTCSTASACTVQAQVTNGTSGTWSSGCGSGSASWPQNGSYTVNSPTATGCVVTLTISGPGGTRSATKTVTFLA